MIEKLIALRQQIENDTGQSIHHLNLNAAALLDDFCRAVGLDDAQIRYILGSGYGPTSEVASAVEVSREHPQPVRLLSLYRQLDLNDVLPVNVSRAADNEYEA
jgi:hypothetical protein